MVTAMGTVMVTAMVTVMVTVIAAVMVAMMVTSDTRVNEIFNHDVRGIRRLMVQ